MMRFFIRIVLFLSLLFATIILTGNYLSKKIVSEALEKYRPQLESHGIDIDKLEYANVRINGIRSMQVRDVALIFNLNKELYGKKSFHAEFWADAVVIQLVNLRDPSILVSLKKFDLSIQPNEASDNPVIGKFEEASWKGQAPIRLYDIRESGHLIVSKIRQLFNENSIDEWMEFKGDAQLNMDGKLFKVGLFTEHKAGKTYLRLVPEDVLEAVKTYDDQLVFMSELEAEIISEYPAWVPKIVKISRDARRLSDARKSADPDFPNDAYKHIYWSYHLTKAFGPEFAKTLTDAHETIPNNTPQERAMDFNNNAVGRQYVLDNVASSELIDKVLTDPAVIRDPGEVNKGN